MVDKFLLKKKLIKKIKYYIIHIQWKMTLENFYKHKNKFGQKNIKENNQIQQEEVI